MINKLRSFLKEIKSLLAYRPLGPLECLMIVFKTNKEIIGTTHLNAQLDVEMDEITAQLNETMKNIDALQRGKGGDT